MSLFKTPKSILDMPAPPHGTHLDLTPKFAPVVNTSEDAIQRSIETAAQHHHTQFVSTAVGSGLVVGDVDEDYPRHVHSTHDHGSFMIANSAEQHAALLETGAWADDPLELVRKEKP